MSVPRIPLQSIPLQNLEANKNIRSANCLKKNTRSVHCPKRKFTIQPDKTKANGKENEDESNPIRAPVTNRVPPTKSKPSAKSESPARSGPSTKSKSPIKSKPPMKSKPLVKSEPVAKKLKSFQVYIDIPLETTEEVLKQLPDPKKQYGGYEKYRNRLPLIEDGDINLFLDNDTPIRILPYDCLLKIFGYCQRTETLISLASVCRSWRNLVLQPTLWKSVSCNLIQFNRQLLKSSNTNKTYKQLEFTQHLILTTREDNIPLQHGTHNLPISPFTNLRTLDLINVRMNDIKYLTQWMTHIEKLRCCQIPVDEYGTVSIPNLSQLTQLKSLELRFNKPCSLKLTYFITIPTLKRLPPSLTELKLFNIQDKEENEINSQDIIDTAAYVASRTQPWRNPLYTPDQILNNWIKLEESLVMKYKMLSYLTNLTTLSLHNTNSYTSRVWRECLIPCSSNISHLDIGGWSGSKESPTSIVNRIHAYRQSSRDELKINDVDHALSEFIAALANIKIITFHRSICTNGIVVGIKSFAKEYTLKEYPCFSIDQLLNESIATLTITVKQEKEEEKKE